MCTLLALFERQPAVVAGDQLTHNCCLRSDKLLASFADKIEGSDRSNALDKRRNNLQKRWAASQKRPVGSTPIHPAFFPSLYEVPLVQSPGAVCPTT